MAKIIQNTMDIFLEEDMKVVLHAHSSHLTCVPSLKDYPFVRMVTGCFIDKWYGKKYYSISFQVGEGVYTKKPNYVHNTIYQEKSAGPKNANYSVILYLGLEPDEKPKVYVRIVPVLFQFQRM